MFFFLEIFVEQCSAHISSKLQQLGEPGVVLGRKGADQRKLFLLWPKKSVFKKNVEKRNPDLKVHFQWF